jgi:hypothetical protein
MFLTSLKFIQLTMEFVKGLLLHLILMIWHLNLQEEIHFVSHRFNISLALLEGKIR